jgi:hypothetical protein
MTLWISHVKNFEGEWGTPLGNFPGEIEKLNFERASRLKAWPSNPCGERGIHQGRVFRDGEGGRSGQEEKSKMQKQKGYFRLTLAVSILAGIIFPISIGIKDPILLGYIFTPLEIMPRCSEAGLDSRIIPTGFNPLRQRLRGECPAGISNGVYFGLVHLCTSEIHYCLLN